MYALSEEILNLNIQLQEGDTMGEFHIKIDRMICWHIVRKDASQDEKDAILVKGMEIYDHLYHRLDLANTAKIIAIAIPSGDYLTFESDDERGAERAARKKFSSPLLNIFLHRTSEPPDIQGALMVSRRNRRFAP
ncbi:hypothetical protein HY250_02445 [Candidatus Azambacteria bacterium]|nr:hypothetical protein [Candidatus Azambacteria bacterium]MBI3685241.1 hypothetical protein [Candidatus Azambacteria bacterium]